MGHLTVWFLWRHSWLLKWESFLFWRNLGRTQHKYICTRNHQGYKQPKLDLPRTFYHLADLHVSQTIHWTDSGFLFYNLLPKTTIKTNKHTKKLSAKFESLGSGRLRTETFIELQTFLFPLRLSGVITLRIWWERTSTSCSRNAFRDNEEVYSFGKKNIWC